MKIPKSHPRYLSLMQRHAIEEGMRKGIVAPAGLIAHGRGEALDYLLGEKTSGVAKRAIRAAAAELLLAERPIISVNGNCAALCAREIIALRKALPNSAIEVNLFYRTRGREEKIARLFAGMGEKILGADKKNQTKIAGLDSARRVVDKRGIALADTVLVMLEDGDRTEALRAIGKRVIAVDLNPLSRTAKKAHITIVDNVCRALPLLAREAKLLGKAKTPKLRALSRVFSNSNNLRASLELIRKGRS
ncbi:MAG: phosphopantothenate/pantothenate synthetase [Candidatus Diapherotrites archaeon]